jgi:hypothetical protein
LRFFNIKGKLSFIVYPELSDLHKTIPRHLLLLKFVFKKSIIKFIFFKISASEKYKSSKQLDVNLEKISN